MEVGSPSVVHDLDMPQLILGVTPPLEDDHAIKRDFAHQKWFYAPYRIVEMFFHLI